MICKKKIYRTATELLGVGDMLKIVSDSGQYPILYKVG